MRIFRKQNKGITLIALVITIILLLILAGITISQLTGSGLFTKAKLSAEETKKSQVQETIQLAVNEVFIEYVSKEKDLTNSTLKEELEKSKSVEGIIIKDDLTGTYQGYDYYIDENYNVHIKGTGNNDNKPVLAKIEGKEEKRKISATVTDAKEGIQKIDIVNPSGEVIATQELDGVVTTGKIENCIANQSGNYKVNVTLNSGDVEDKIINVKKIEISNKAELEDFRAMVISGVTFEGDTVELVDNIDLEGNESNINWYPIGGSGTGTYFSGIFEGNNHHISNIYDKETTKGQRGLFGQIKNGTVQNLGIESGSIIGNFTCGGIVGRIDNGNIINCYNKAKIEGGQLSTDQGAIGGIAGNTFNTIIQSCYNLGEINGFCDCTGGIVGQLNQKSKILNCFNIGSINSPSWTGGIVGNSTGGENIVNNCYNKGSVTATKGVGGLVGYIGVSDEIKNSYNLGEVTGNSKAGGVIGEHNGFLSNLFFINTAGPLYGCGLNNVEGNVLEGQGSTIETLKGLTNKLNGTQTDIPWKDDTENINEGYPILSWQ